MIGKTNSQTGSTIRGEKLNISLITNQSNHSDLIGAVITVSHVGGSTEYIWKGLELTIEIPPYVEYSVEYGAMNGYATPDMFTSTSVPGNSRTLKGIYECELLTVNVSANKGEVSGFEITIAKQETIGTAFNYIKLEYIESNGTQYINTRVKPNNNTRVVMDVEFITKPANSVWLFGSRTSATSKNYSVVYSSGVQALRSDYNNVYSQEFTYPTGRFIIDKNKETTTIGSETKSYTNSAFHGDYSMYLFASNNAGSVSAKASLRLYSCKIYDNGELVRDFIPALNNSGVAGLYDAVEDSFYSFTESGFIQGPECGEVLAIQTKSTDSYNIPFGTDYLVRASIIEDCTAPNTIYRKASSNNYIAQMQYKKGDYKTTTIRIDQTVSDPETMITRIFDEGGIESIRDNSHRYTGVYSGGVMTLKQLEDRGGAKYDDGTDATLDELGIDVWMKLPRFHWKCTEHSAGVWDFEVVFGAKPDNTYNNWDGKDLIGVYEAYNSSGKIYSVSGKDSTGGVSQADFKTYARARGEGFSLVKWKHHCMMAMLYYTMYGNTNSQAEIGKGVNSYNKITGATNSLGMTDTVSGDNGDSNSINFWGLENWWGNKCEFIDDLEVDGNVWRVVEDDGSLRQAGTGISSSGYISKLMFGEHIDMIPVEVNGSYTTGFCDYYFYGSDGTHVVMRSESRSLDLCGVSNLDSGGSSSVSRAYNGSRLAFRGEYVIV